LDYKGYLGDAKFDSDAGIFHGDVINTRDAITFQGKSVDELIEAFHGSVDYYLEFCAKRGEEPDKPFSGQFMTRIPPELHREVNVAAKIAGKSLNAWVTEQLERAVSDNAASDAPAKKQGPRAKSAPPRIKRTPQRSVGRRTDIPRGRG